MSSEKTIVKSSSRHGVGVFATQPLHLGDHPIEYHGVKGDVVNGKVTNDELQYSLNELVGFKKPKTKRGIAQLCKFRPLFRRAKPTWFGSPWTQT
jgi:hypothetical protein